MLMSVASHPTTAVLSRIKILGQLMTERAVTMQMVKVKVRNQAGKALVVDRVTKITTTARTNTRSKAAAVDPKVITPVNSRRLASSAMQEGATRVARR